MPANKFTATGVRKQDAIRIVERIMSNTYSSGDVITQELKDYTRVKSKSQEDEVRVSETDGGSRIDLMMATSQVADEVRNQLGDNVNTGQEIHTDTSRGKERQQAKGIDGYLGEVVKPFSQDEAGYVERGDSGFNPSHDKCKDCAHYDNHGACHIVPDIDKDGYCKEYYADVGFFAVGAEISGETAEVNLTFWGENYAKKLEMSSAGAIVEGIRSTLTDKLGERNVQFIRD